MRSSFSVEKQIDFPYSDLYNCNVLFPIKQSETEDTMEEFYINDDGISLHAKLDRPADAKNCPLCIIFHGFTGHMEERHITAAAAAFNSIGIATLRVDLYGHGGSDGEFRKHTLYKWINNALAVVDYAGKLDFITDMYLCGHSQGGLLVMLTAGLRPECFRAIIPMSPAWMIPNSARAGQMLGTSFDPEHVPDELVGEFWCIDGNYIRVAQTIHTEDFIHRYNGPVLIVHGDADELVPVSCAYKAHELYKNSELTIIPGDTHCYDNHLDAAIDAARNFLLSFLDSTRTNKNY